MNDLTYGPFVVACQLSIHLTPKDIHNSITTRPKRQHSGHFKALVSKLLITSLGAGVQLTNAQRKSF